MAKRFTAIILALAMALSLVTVNVFAAAEDLPEDYTVAFEWTGSAEDGGSASTIFGSKLEDFLTAMNTEGAYIELSGKNPCSQHGSMTNIFLNGSEWSNGHSLGYPTGEFTRGVTVKTALESCKKEAPITAVRFQVGVYDHGEGNGADDCEHAAEKVVLTGVKVYVPASAEEPDEGGDAGEEEEEDEVLYTLPADKLGEMSTGWVNVVSGAEVAKFTDALSAYGAVLTIKTDITADDIDASKGLWISICAQSTSDWATGNVPNGVVETAESGTTLTYKGSDILDFVEEKGWTGAVQFALNNSNLTVDTFELISFEVTAPKVEEEKLPDGYVADEKIEVGDDNVEVSADGKTVTVTPDDDLKTEGLLIKFDKPAPADGTVTVNYGEPEKAPEDKVLFTHEWSIESNWHSLNKKWNAADFTKLLEALQVENAVVKVEYTGDQGWGLQIGLKDGDLNKMYTVEGVKHDTATKTATVYAADVYALAAANGMDYETVDNCEFYVNTGHSEAHNLTLSVIVPAEAVPAAASLEEGETASVTASFKAGATFVVVDTSEYKDEAITSVVISVESGKAPTVSEVLVKKAKQKKQGIEGYNGYIVQLGAQYHGLFMGGPRLIPMPHTFVGDTCTACGYHKISLH